jgi:negative regulator of sigma E activity
MTDCERLSDRMPDVALHRAAWSAEEAAHLAGCAECRAEWDLVQATQRLEQRAPSVDPAAIAASVQRRLAAERVARRRTRWILAAAGSAAAAAAVALAVVAEREERPAIAPHAVAEAEPLVPLPELEGLDTAQLDTLLHALDEPFGGTSTLESSTLGDGAEDELEWILATWEG